MMTGMTRGRETKTVKVIIEVEAVIEYEGNVTIDEIVMDTDNAPFVGLTSAGKDNYYALESGDVIGWREQEGGE